MVGDWVAETAVTPAADLEVGWEADWEEEWTVGASERTQ